MESFGMVLVWFILLVQLHPPRCTYANEEGTILSAFKVSLHGDPNNVLESWDPTLVNPCTWFHVTCDKDDYVLRIDLGNSQLSGTLTTGLGGLKRLQYMELYQNNISGIIPKELGDITSLVSLDLYTNNLDGPIPRTLGKLSNLRFLRISGNRLTDSIPAELTNMKSLQVLDLSNNDLSGVVPINGSFSKFTSLSFQGNPRLRYP